MSFWLWMCAGCAVSALAGFSLVRFAAPGSTKLLAYPVVSVDSRSEGPARAPLPDASAQAATVAEPRAVPVHTEAPRQRALRPMGAAAKQRSRAARPPAPTAAAPGAEKLALWARQIKAGERKMSVATDGCRVTWDRTCKHGHLTWLVRLGYLQRAQPEGPRDEHEHLSKQAEAAKRGRRA